MCWVIVVLSALTATLTILIWRYTLQDGRKKPDNRASKLTPEQTMKVPESVNYHFTRQCNYQCGFCFHTAKTSSHLAMEDAEKGLLLLKEAGMKKINFSGGEPFLIERGNHVGKMVRYCKEKLGLESVSIVSNGSLVTEKWFSDYGQWLDMIAISCDSFDEAVNKRIGRFAKRKNHIQSLKNVRKWCAEYGIIFKINTVVNSFNYEEDMRATINELQPKRWKVFQCLLIGGENCGPDALRNAETFVISSDQFEQFLIRHSSCTPAPTAEDNETMMNSYLILDEYMRFLNCQNGTKEPSRSILDVGVDNALNCSGFDEAAYIRRGGRFKWSKNQYDDSW